MGVREKMQAGSDKVQTKLAAKGLREYTVNLVPPPAGRNALMGTPSTTPPTPVLLAPTPKVKAVSLKDIAAGNGVIKVGDIKISKITRSSTFEALVKAPSTIWRLTGPGDIPGDYSPVGGSLELRLPNATVIVRRVKT